MKNYKGKSLIVWSMNNKVGKEIVLDGIHLGKVIAGPTEDPCKGLFSSS